MNIGILGAGNIGRTLGKHWAQRGHTIRFGARDSSSPKTQAALTACGENAAAGTLAEAGAFGQVVVLAVPWAAVRATLAAAGDLGGKVLIDATNRITPPGPEEEASAGLTVAKWARGANVVKAFNSMGWETIADPRFGDGRATAFICGDDDRAKQVVMQLARETGLETADAGGLEMSAVTEAMVRMWLGMTRRDGRQIAFALLRR
jgi:predicted dinucleotide-binding enzyme